MGEVDSSGLSDTIKIDTDEEALLSETWFAGEGGLDLGNFYALRRIDGGVYNLSMGRDADLA